MNNETKILVKLKIADNACNKLLRNHLLPGHARKIETVRDEILHVQRAIVKPWGEKKKSRCYAEGDLFLNSVTWQAKSQRDFGGDKNAELFFCYVLTLIAEDFQEFSSVRKHSETLLGMCHELVSLCRKKTHYMGMLEFADEAVKDAYKLIDTFKETEAKPQIMAFSSKSVGDKLAEQYRRTFNTWGSSAYA